jgi:hypothetical protein
LTVGKEPDGSNLSQRRTGRPYFGAAILALCFAAVAGCAQSKPTFQLEKTLPGSNSIPGWKPAGEAQTYNRETLFDYIDGSSEYFFTYTFEVVAVNRYLTEGGGSLNAEIWQLAASEDAYGLFSGRAGGDLLAIGGAKEAALESGTRLVFWQNRYYVSLTAIQAVTDEDLRRFAEFISKALPAGGEKPALIGRLPVENLIPGSEKFFHMELAIQDRLWLGGENKLGLGMDTDAVLARCPVGDTEWQLLLVEYPDSSRAEAGRQALLGGLVEELVGVNTNGPLLAALFGLGGGDLAEIIMDKALGK